MRLAAGFKYYILSGHTPTVVDPLAWSEWMFGENGKRNRSIAQTNIGSASVSTVFLGIDHDHFRKGPPLLYETMVFGGPMDGQQRRCSFYKQAQRQHDAMVADVKAALALS